MITAVSRYFCYPLGRTLRQSQTSTGDGYGRALMNTNSVAMRVVHRSDRRGIRRIYFYHFHPGSKGRRLPALLVCS
jgi:hypothetical protein